jgi:hypothetical protein
MDVPALADLLHETAQRHGSTPDEASAAAGRYLEEAKLVGR